MRNKREPEEFMRDMRERQRSYVFPDTVRNAGGFWRGISNQKLKGFQWFGLIFVVAFQIGMFALAVRLEWPQGPGPMWEKVVYGYWPYLLLSLPLIGFFLLLRRSIRKR